MYLRSFKKGGKRYYYVAKAVRTGKRIVQKYVLYLGTADTIYGKLSKSQKKG